MEHGVPIEEAHKLPGTITLSSADDEKLAYEFGRITAIEAKDIGYNLVWGPVVDIEPGLRGLGLDPYKTAKYAELIARGYMDEGLFCTPKHFPGSGGIFYDTHMYFDAKSEKDEKELLEYDLVPYLEMMKHSALIGIMTSHNRFPKIDPKYPASLSEKIISIIRNAGYDGLILTDSFAMMGVLDEFGDERSIAYAIRAGNDMVLPNYRISYEQSLKYVENAYNSGIITPERLDDAVRHILIAQDFAQKPASRSTLSDEQLEYIEKMNESSICAITDDGVQPYIEKDKKHLFVVLTENLYLNKSGVPFEFSPSSRWKPDEICKQISDEFPDSTIVRINEFPNPGQILEVCKAYPSHDDIIFLTYCKCLAYGGSDGLTERVLTLMDATKGKLAAIAHMGTPNTLESAPHSPRVIWSNPGQKSTENMIDILSGKLEPKGKLPYKLNLK
jgi:beta-glucosidase-like glycosyl hydrolase